MKKFTLLLSALLMVSFSALAQIKMVVHLNDAESIELYASSVDSITFTNFPDGPVGPKPDPNTPNANGHEYVDLGLPSGLLWATCNVGANSPEEYGDNFAWGETKPKTTYDYDTYYWYFNDELTKYCTDSEYGTVDYKTILELSDDAANANWGGDWRMPTNEDLDELRSQCTWTWSKKNGANGYMVTGPNGNNIFLPAAGHRDDLFHGPILVNAGSNGSYWSSSLDTDGFAYGLSFGSGYMDMIGNDRLYGLSVRPVMSLGFTFDVAFDSNGGDGTMQSIAIKYAEVFSIPENKFTRPGYEFICWSTKADGTGINYEDGAKFSIGSDITLYAQWYRKETNITHEYVDLGLSVKWATCNVGANKPEETGYFFSWGETKPKAKYNMATYKWCNGDYFSMTKYCTSSSYGTVDNKTTLELTDDAANANWGGDWRMPTEEEQQELIDDCTWDRTTKNGVNGYIVTGPNGNSIFLPAAGGRYGSVFGTAEHDGSYWSSSLYYYSSHANDLNFRSDYVGLSNASRDCGLSVRPVMP